jgi:hypothetical protein
MKATDPAAPSLNPKATTALRWNTRHAWRSLCIAVMSAFVLISVPMPDALAQGESALIINGKFSANTDGWVFSKNGLSYEVKEVDQAPSVPGVFPQHCLSVTLTPPSDSKPFSQQMLQQLRQEVGEGKVVTVKFWARSPESLEIEAIWGETVAPYAASALSSVKLTPTWTQYEVSGVAARTFPAREAMVRFHLGNVAGRIDLTGIEVTQN